MSKRSLAPLIALLALLSTHCGERNEVCDVGEERSCAGPGECAGTQWCVPDPTDWSDCECLKPAGTGGSGGRMQGPPPKLGAPCRTQGECPAGAQCLTERSSALRGGGPPQGMCVADCSKDASACGKFSEAVCVRFDEPDAAAAFCFPSCEHGTASLAKCGGRTDLACERLEEDDTHGFCRPFCARNEDCESGFCDRRNGVCVEADAGNDFGRPCSLQGEADECSGICVELEGTDVAVCSQRCVYGSAAPCGTRADTPGLCALAADGGSQGDIGYCAELCDCGEQCSHPDFSCDAFSSATVREQLGNAGVCAAVTDADPEPLVCD